MLYLVSGGSGSGKSAYAEKIAVYKSRKESVDALYYIATMAARDEESLKRIKKHRNQRYGKGFETIECPSHLESLYERETPSMQNSVFLLECMSNLLANEMYLPGGRLQKNEVRTQKELETAILMPLRMMIQQADTTVVVTNEVFSDGCKYAVETQEYISLLGNLNQMLAQEADTVVEVVCGIPIARKGVLPC